MSQMLTKADFNKQPISTERRLQCYSKLKKKNKSITTKVRYPYKIYIDNKIVVP